MAFPDEDPKTLEALDKIKQVLIEYNLWGVISVCDEDRSHWLYHFDPTWSCMYVNLETGEVRVRAKEHEFATPEMHKKVVQQTVSAVFSTRDYAAMLFIHMDRVAKMLSKTLNVKHNPYMDIRYRK